MKFNKPNFWDKKLSLISFFLIPLSLISILIIFLKKKFKKELSFEIPIICVGNIYIGGTGKTPTSIFLAKELLNKGKKPLILRKFYNSHKDEYDLIKANFKNLILDKNRVQGIIKAKKKGFDSVILDDGFQEYNIKKDLSIICFNQNQQIGNGLIFPAGPLRENLNSLAEAEIVLINGKKNVNFENKIFKINKDINIFYSKYKPLNIKQFKNKKLFAIAGIGNPENFFKLLTSCKLNVKKKFIFPDHYEFSKNEILNITKDAKKNNCEIIMTEKDYYKVKKFNNKLKYLKIFLEIENKKKFFKIISRVYDKNN